MSQQPCSVHRYNAAVHGELIWLRLCATVLVIAAALWLLYEVGWHLSSILALALSLWGGKLWLNLCRQELQQANAWRDSSLLITPESLTLRTCAQQSSSMQHPTVQGFQVAWHELSDIAIDDAQTQILLRCIDGKVLYLSPHYGSFGLWTLYQTCHAAWQAARS